MEEPLPTGQGAFAVHLTAEEFAVAPGQTITIPLLVYNQGAEEQELSLSVRGVPSHWVSVPSPIVHLAPGEQRQMMLTVQPPAFPNARAGRHALVVRVASQQAPTQAVEKTCSLTVAALEVPGRIGVLLAATEFSVMPGDSTSIPLVVVNHGLDADTFALSVDGIPSAWVYAPSATVSLAPGQQQEMTLTVQPPASGQTRAGRHPFRIQVSSRGAPGQAAEAECILTVASFTQFEAELRPQRVEAGQPARVTVENQGNVQHVFTLELQSPSGEVTFEPEEAQQVPVPPGEVGVAEFRPLPRRRPMFGGEVSHPFTGRVRAPNQETKNVTGEVVTRGWVPSWVLPAVVIVILALVAAVVVIGLLGDKGAEAPATEVPPAVETEVPPTEAPPEPTQPPPEPTQPPPEPTQPPPEPTQPPPEPTEAPPDQPTAEPQPTEPGDGGGIELPCLPAAAGLVLVPLLVRGRRRRLGGF